MRYTPYGSTRYTWGNVPTARRFTGQVEEAWLGLYYYRARWYDPALGRFVQADTIVPEPGNTQSLNRYSYVLNSPLKYQDPTGHVAWVPLIMAGGAILTTVTYAVTTDNFEVGECLLAAGAGAVGGALIGTGVGAVAGSALIAGVATGAGVGALAAAESYMVTTDNFDSADLAINTAFGAVEGGACALPGVGPLGAGAISAASSAAQSVASDVAHDRPVDWGRATSDALWGGATGFAAVGIAELAVPSSPGIDIGQGPPVIHWIPPKPIADRVAAQAQREAFRGAVRSFGAETTYYVGSDTAYEVLQYLYESYGPRVPQAGP